jgi:hypothetical protein
MPSWADRRQRSSHGSETPMKSVGRAKRDRNREKGFTKALVIMVSGMKSRELDFDYLFLLEALERGVVPADEYVGMLLGMGLVERTADGLALTMEARVKLANLRSLMREYRLPHG